MAIREELVASATKFLQDPSVASAPIENRIAFLQAKNLTQEEVNVALARADPAAATPTYATPPASGAVAQPQQYYGQYPPQFPPPYGWQTPPQAPPRRDWRDWFIMATVVSGVGYGLYALGKRYVYPLVSPPTPERLEQDKKSIDEQFDRTFALVEQLAKDTEALKAAETERTEKLDTALAELEAVIQELKTANRRREDEAQRVREEVKNLKATVPQAMENQKEATDRRMRDLNTELKSLKTLIAQRMAPQSTPAGVGNYLRPSSGNTAPAPGGSAPAPGSENAVEEVVASAPAVARSPFGTGMPGGKASIPAWQLAMASKNATPGTTSSASNGVESEAAGSSSQDASASS
ncbi:hypothetical protein GQ53DRAFT_742863 [Thozetella sp. PMI_491]|nr:hypothetical protein GQ53DRAFT_742863 [Thozetella sp. PMI_491]